jgi:Fur family ferric uptake transcriptional regulator
MRRTPQRQLVWEALERLGAHCTADEIAAELRRDNPAIHRSTVYRILEAMVAAGLVRPVHLGTGAVHYEAAGEDHLHAVCQSCGCILHLEHHLTAELTSHLAADHRFTPVRTDVLVTGICYGCAHRPPGPSSPRSRRTVEHHHFT